MDGYQNGTKFGIHMDTDGLICAGGGLAQVTWMDVRVGEILPTPRHGKPVEINAYWYNALKIMETFTEEAETSRYYAQLAEKVRIRLQKNSGCRRKIV
jgi:predicted glycogen debranching enzyme|nr:amylo-alpha-1,6-glucosidase [Mediterraneibacter gnavus]